MITATARELVVIEVQIPEHEEVSGEAGLQTRLLAWQIQERIFPARDLGGAWPWRILLAYSPDDARRVLAWLAAQGVSTSGQEFC